MKKIMLFALAFSLVLLSVSCNNSGSGNSPTPTPAQGGQTSDPRVSPNSSTNPGNTNTPVDPTDSNDPVTHGESPAVTSAVIEPLTDTIGSVSVTYPGESVVAKSESSLTINNGSVDAAAIVVISITGFTNLSPADFMLEEGYLENFLRGYSSSYDDVEVLTSEKGTLAGRDAYVIEFTGKLSDGQSMHIKSYSFSHNSNTYNVLAFFTEAGAAVGERYIDDVLSTVSYN